MLREQSGAEMILFVTPIIKSGSEIIAFALETVNFASPIINSVLEIIFSEPDTITDIDAGSLTNIATASFGAVTSNSASVTVTANRTMSIDLMATATPNFSSPSVAGDTINYNFKITNTGSITLSGVVLTDASLSAFATGGICGGVTTFNPGASISCSAIYTVMPQDISAGHVSVTHVAQACGNPSSGPTVCDTLNVRVEQ